MINSIPLYVIYPAAIVSAAIISLYAVQKVLFIARRSKIYDVPDKIRKIHGDEIPSLGGIGIFTGYLIIAAFFWPRNHFFMPAILCSSVILFFTGIYDDLMNMRPSKKLIAQLIASFITVYFADIRLDSCFGLFGIGTIPYWPGIALTTLCCTFFINVFNFIDGIDGLAGVMSILYLGILGYAFAATEHPGIAGISFALTGATVGLLFYNIAPAKIYMGDTGSMFLGFSIFSFSLLFVKWCSTGEINSIVLGIRGPQQALILVIALLFVPVYDGIRVFILRASRGVSPLKADRAHLHYYLLDAGFSHTQAVFVITATNICIIVLAYLLQGFNPYITLVSITLLMSALVLIIYKLRQKKLG